MASPSDSHLAARQFEPKVSRSASGLTKWRRLSCTSQALERLQSAVVSRWQSHLASPFLACACFSRKTSYKRKFQALSFYISFPVLDRRRMAPSWR